MSGIDRADVRVLPDFFEVRHKSGTMSGTSFSSRFRHLR